MVRPAAAGFGNASGHWSPCDGACVVQWSAVSGSAAAAVSAALACTCGGARTRVSLASSDLVPLTSLCASTMEAFDHGFVLANVRSREHNDFTLNVRVYRARVPS